jgi:hypothetical protein
VTELVTLKVDDDLTVITDEDCKLEVLVDLVVVVAVEDDVDEVTVAGELVAVEDAAVVDDFVVEVVAIGELVVAEELVDVELVVEEDG